MPIRCCATTKRRRAGLPVARGDSHRLPEAELTFELDGQPLVLAGSKGEKEQKKGTDQPQLLILSSGELSPFRLRLAERGPEGRALSLSSDGFRLPRSRWRGDEARVVSPCWRCWWPWRSSPWSRQRAQRQRAQPAERLAAGRQDPGDVDRRQPSQRIATGTGAALQRAATRRAGVRRASLGGRTQVDSTAEQDMRRVIVWSRRSPSAASVAASRSRRGACRFLGSQP